MSNTKSRSVRIAGVDLNVEMFIDSAFLQMYLDELDTIGLGWQSRMRNALLTCEYFGLEQEMTILKIQESYFNTLGAVEGAEDLDFNKHEDFQRTLKSLRQTLRNKQLPEVVFNAIHHLI